MNYKCVIIAEMTVQEAYGFKTLDQLNAFSEGVTAGSAAYGAGSCGTYTKEEIETQDHGLDDDIVREALEMLEELAD